LRHDPRQTASGAITVGRPDWPTPLGSYWIASLSLNPTWNVPPAIRAEMEDEGMPTSAQVKFFLCLKVSRQYVPNFFCPACKSTR
jgi:hypothetical protein